MIYLDHAAATPIDPAVLKKILPFLKEEFGNASSVHAMGRAARAAIELARADISVILQCAQKEIVFTSGGTEANNWAIFGLAQGLGSLNPNLKQDGSGQVAGAPHIISTKIEHPSILEPLKKLESGGYKVTYLNVDKNGFIDLEELKKSITPQTIFASIIYANNEIGVIQNMQGIAKILKEQGIIFHTDACQAAEYLEITPQKLGVDLMTLNSGKIYGPKGAGALYIKKNTKIAPLLYGGGQEFRLRAGTENTAAIVGFAEALKLAQNQERKTKEAARLIKLRDQFISELLKIQGATLNGPGGQAAQNAAHKSPADQPTRLPNNINISIKGVDAESLLLRLDMAGIAASSGSACSSGSLEPSHVLQALNLPADLAKNSLRLTLGRGTTGKELHTVAKALKELILELNPQIA